MGVKAWITVNGQHIPIMDGESKMQAVGKFIRSKREKEIQKMADDVLSRNSYKNRELAEATSRMTEKMFGPKIKGQNRFFKGAKVQVEDSYSGEKRGEYRVKGKMDKDRSKMLYGSAVTGYDIEATGKFAEKLNKAGVNGKSQSNNYRMSLYPNKYKLKTDRIKKTPVSSINVDTTSFRGTHGKEPGSLRVGGSSRGNWAFKLGKETIFINDTYSNAKKQALKEASRRGLWSIKVLG